MNRYTHLCGVNTDLLLYNTPSPSLPVVSWRMWTEMFVLCCPAADNHCLHPACEAFLYEVTVIRLWWVFKSVLFSSRRAHLATLWRLPVLSCPCLWFMFLLSPSPESSEGVHQPPSVHGFRWRRGEWGHSGPGPGRGGLQRGRFDSSALRQVPERSERHGKNRNASSTTPNHILLRKHRVWSQVWLRFWRPEEQHSFMNYRNYCWYFTAKPDVCRPKQSHCFHINTQFKHFLPGRVYNCSLQKALTSMVIMLIRLNLFPFVSWSCSSSQTKETRRRQKLTTWPS